MRNVDLPTYGEYGEKDQALRRQRAEGLFDKLSDKQPFKMG
jgi:hypothetical protein